jgi:hypothetical protein
MARMEIWMHLCAPHQFRGCTAKAAEAHGVLPRWLSFKVALQAMTAFHDPLRHAPPSVRDVLWKEMVRAIASQHVGDPFGSAEPGVNKRRPKPRRYLDEPRCPARKRLMKAAQQGTSVPFTSDLQSNEWLLKSEIMIAEDGDEGDRHSGSNVTQPFQESRTRDQSSATRRAGGARRLTGGRPGVSVATGAQPARTSAQQPPPPSDPYPPGPYPGPPVRPVTRLK